MLSLRERKVTITSAGDFERFGYSPEGKTIVVGEDGDIGNEY